jgi:urease accessory protein
VYASTLGGGLVDGDHLAIDVSVDERATLFFTTQASTKVYRSPSRTSQTLTARVAEGALLASVPDPVACFGGARYQQRTRIDVEEGGSLVCWEAFTAGRIAHGERWIFDSFASTLEIRAAGALRVRDAVLLEPSAGPIARRMGRFDAMGTLVLVGPRVARARARLLDANEPRFELRPDAITSAASLGDDGLIVRIAARSVSLLGQSLRAHLAFLDDELGESPFARRP